MFSGVQQNSFISIYKGFEPAEQCTLIVAECLSAEIRLIQICLHFAEQIGKGRIEIRLRHHIPVNIPIGDQIPASFEIDIVQALLQDVRHGGS